MTDWTEHSIDSLMAALRSGGCDTPLDLAEEFRRRGPAVVEPLCSVLRDPSVWTVRQEPEEMLPIHALLLLGSIADPRAWPDVVAAARAHDLDEYTWDDVPPVLAAFGLSAVPDLRALAMNPEAPYYARAPALRALYLLGCDHPSLRAEVTTLGIDILRAKGVTHDLAMHVSFALHDTGEPAAIAAVHDTVARGALDDEFDAAVQGSPSDGPWAWGTFHRDPMHHFGPNGTLEYIRKRHRADREWAENREAEARARGTRTTLAPLVSTPTGMRRAEPKIGRNDPCPCGSGLEYKKCHGK